MPIPPFGPTGRPFEPPTTGAVPLGGPTVTRPEDVLRALYRKRPSPWIARLLNELR